MGRSWVLVASRFRARVLECENPTAQLREIGDLVAPRDEDGQPLPKPEVGESALSTPTVIEHGGKPGATIMEEICNALEAVGEAGGFQRLFIIAEPAFIESMRHRLAVSVRRRLAGELPLDLTWASAAEIRSYLPELL